mgnify:CR=1 FL=1
MPQFDGLIGLLDSRSFGTIWFWIVLIAWWSASGRTVLGVPTEVLVRARRIRREGRPEADEVIALLDWLSLTLPRWRLGRAEGAGFLGLGVFALTVLAITGFGYGLEMAQALTLLLVPMKILFWMRILLARRLMPLLVDAQSGARPVADAAGEAVGRMTLHRRLVWFLSIVSVAVTALWGTLWMLLNPLSL